MTTRQIADYIREREPWTAEKEKELIHELGGFTKWGEDYYATYSYEVAVDQVDDAMKELAKDAETDPDEFAKEMQEWDF